MQCHQSRVEAGVALKDIPSPRSTLACQPLLRSSSTYPNWGGQLGQLLKSPGLSQCTCIEGGLAELAREIAFGCCCHCVQYKGLGSTIEAPAWQAASPVLESPGPWGFNEHLSCVGGRRTSDRRAVLFPPCVVITEV